MRILFKCKNYNKNLIQFLSTQNVFLPNIIDSFRIKLKYDMQFMDQNNSFDMYIYSTTKLNLH